jgi:NADP-dependent 3-hydroxy acid dehydrogenase YdfG
VRPRPLQERVVLVTGASSGLGEAIARSCARDGACMVLAARREERRRAVEAELEAAGAARYAPLLAVNRLAPGLVDAFARRYGGG